MEVTGRIKFIGHQQQVTATFSKRELVVTTEEQYPQHIMIEFTQDKCALLDQYQVGEQVKVSINLRGREWTNPQGETKYFNSIQGWRIEKEQVNNYAQPAPSMNTFNPPSEFSSQNFGNSNNNFNTTKFEPMSNSFSEDENDDLPF